MQYFLLWCWLIFSYSLSGAFDSVERCIFFPTLSWWTCGPLSLRFLLWLLYFLFYSWQKFVDSRKTFPVEKYWPRHKCTTLPSFTPDRSSKSSSENSAVWAQRKFLSFSVMKKKRYFVLFETSKEELKLKNQSWSINRSSLTGTLSSGNLFPLCNIFFSSFNLTVAFLPPFFRSVCLHDALLIKLFLSVHRSRCQNSMLAESQLRSAPSDLFHFLLSKAVSLILLWILL